MIFQALSAAILVALISLIGVVFFGHDKRLIGIEKYAVPTAVGVFLSIILYELIPETLEVSPEWGGIVIAVGFVSFYVLSQKLHKHFHHLEEDDCDKKGGAALLLVGDSIHNISDGVILGGAFLIDPSVGFLVAIGLALHEIPQEIVEFGVLIRAGYTRLQASILNLLSASGIIVGLILVLVLSEYMTEGVWILNGLAAGNLLFLAASDLLPRIHGNLKHYGSIWNSTIAIMIGFLVMTSILIWSHEKYEHGASAEEVVVEVI